MVRGRSQITYVSIFSNKIYYNSKIEPQSLLRSKNLLEYWKNKQWAQRCQRTGCYDNRYQSTEKPTNQTCAGRACASTSGKWCVVNPMWRNNRIRLVRCISINYLVYKAPPTDLIIVVSEPLGANSLPQDILIWT